MINKDRIVPIEKKDYLSLIGEVLGLASVSYTVAEAPDVDGTFTVTAEGDAGVVLANQPAKSIDFAEGTTGGTVYFVANFDFEGFKIAGTAAETTVDVAADGITLYKAVLADGEITVTAVTPSV